MHVDLECGESAQEHCALTFDSHLAAVDCVLSHVLKARDIVIVGRGVRPGTLELLRDWYGKRASLDVAVEWFDGQTMEDFSTALKHARERHAERLAAGRNIHVFLESPCHPAGYVLDVPAICRAAHAGGLTVICDSALATPFLQTLLRREEPAERPDFLVSGPGAGVLIGRKERMFIAEGESVKAHGADAQSRLFNWDETLYWNVYRVKGGGISHEAAIAAANSLRALEVRMLHRCINTVVQARVLAAHPKINVHCSAVPGDPNHLLARRLLFLGLPPPLFAVDFDSEEGEWPWLDAQLFQDLVTGLQSGGTAHENIGNNATAEQTSVARVAGGTGTTTLAVAVCEEDPRLFLAHFIRTALRVIEPKHPGFARGFMSSQEIDKLYETIYLSAHLRFVRAKRVMASLLA